jgi:hypothetical protein
MRSIGTWLRTRPVRLHALIAALVTTSVVALLFSLLWLAGLVLQIASLFVVFFFVYAYHQAGIR